MRIYIFVIAHLLLLAQGELFFPNELWHHMETCPRCLNCQNFMENDCPRYNAILQNVQQQQEQAAVQNNQQQPGGYLGQGNLHQPALGQTYHQPQNQQVHQPYVPPSPPAQAARTYPARLGLDDDDRVPSPQPLPASQTVPAPVPQIGSPGASSRGVSNFQQATQPDQIEQALENTLANMREQLSEKTDQVTQTLNQEQRELQLQRQMELVEGQGFPYIQSPRSQQHANPMPIPSPQRLPAPEHIGSSGVSSSRGWNLDAANQAQLDRELQEFLEIMEKQFQEEEESGGRRSNQLMIREPRGPGSNVDESVDASADPIGDRGQEKRKGKTMERQDSKIRKISIKALVENSFKADPLTKPIDQHQLTKNRDHQKSKVKKLCWGCASKGKKNQCDTYCPDCAKDPKLCLDCFNETHNQTETLKPVIAGNIVALGKDRVTGQIDRLNKEFPPIHPEKPLSQHTLETRYNEWGDGVIRHCRLCYNKGECTLPEHSHLNEELQKQDLVFIDTFCPDCVGQPSLCKNCFHKVHHIFIKKN